jgi:hypothetical protein
MTAWPSTIPSVPDGGVFRETGADVLVRSANDTGPDKVRRRTTAGVRLFSFALVLTPEQAAALDAFYDGDLLGGSLGFTFPHPRTGTMVPCRFRAPLVFSPGPGALVRVALELEGLP